MDLRKINPEILKIHQNKGESNALPFIYTENQYVIYYYPPGYKGLSISTLNGQGIAPKMNTKATMYKIKVVFGAPPFLYLI